MKLKNKLLYTSIIIALFSQGFKTSQATYNILDFGAKGDGKTINTRAINDAISTCNKNGGGTVEVPSGNYLTGTIVLLSNINLHLEPGSVITGSKDTLDYKKNDNPLFAEGYTRYGLVYANNARNISINGSGEINGNGTYFMNGLDKPHMGHDFDRKYTRQGQSFMKEGSIFEDGPVSYNYRPGLMMQIQNCEDVQINNIFLRDAPEWTIRLADCDNVVVDGITIENNPLIPNNDGIHCTNSRNIRISNAYISTGDDCIIVSGFGEESEQATKSEKNKFGNKTGFAESVTVDNCVLSCRSAGIRIGYGFHPIRNCVFSNIIMYNCNRGIGIFSRDRSAIENILFSNIIINTRLFSGHWWGKGEPIHISAVQDSREGNTGKIKNIRFMNVSAFSETGIIIYGSKNSIIENLLFDHVQLSINRGKYTDTYGGNFDLRPAYPVSSALFSHDIPGFYAQYVKNLNLINFELTWGDKLPDFFTNGIEIRNFQDITIDHFKGKPAFLKNGLASIYLIDGRHAAILREAGLKNSSYLKLKKVTN